MSLVAEEAAKGFIQKLQAEYPPYKELDDEKFSATVFTTKPGKGAFGMNLRDVFAFIAKSAPLSTSAQLKLKAI